jgi:hypothetical protein
MGESAGHAPTAFASSRPHTMTCRRVPGSPHQLYTEMRESAKPRLFDAIRAGSSETALVAGWAGAPRPGGPSLDTQAELTAGGHCRLISAECPLPSRSAHPPAWPGVALKRRIRPFAWTRQMGRVGLGECVYPKPDLALPDGTIFIASTLGQWLPPAARRSRLPAREAKASIGNGDLAGHISRCRAGKEHACRNLSQNPSLRGADNQLASPASWSAASALGRPGTEDRPAS